MNNFAGWIIATNYNKDTEKKHILLRKNKVFMYALL